MHDYIEWIIESRGVFDHSEIMELRKAVANICDIHKKWDYEHSRNAYNQLKPVIEYADSSVLQDMYNYYSVLPKIKLFKKHFGNRSLPIARLYQLAENIKEANTIIEKNLDLDDENLLYNNDHYKKLKNIWLFLPIEGFINAEYYFLKYHLKREKIEPDNFAKSELDIMVTSCFEEPKYEYLYEVIYNDILIENGILGYDGENISGKKEPDDKHKKDYKKEIIRGKIDRIKDALPRLDINCDWHYKHEPFELLKLLKLIYMYRCHDEIIISNGKILRKKNDITVGCHDVNNSNKNIMKLLDEPSMENLFPGISVPGTTNGEIFFNFKNEIMKALSPEEIQYFLNFYFYMLGYCELEIFPLLRRFLGIKLSVKFLKKSIPDIIEKQQCAEACALDALKYIYNDIIAANEKLKSIKVVEIDDSKPKNRRLNSIFLKIFSKIITVEVIGQIKNRQKVLNTSLADFKVFEGHFREIFWETETRLGYINFANAEEIVRANINIIAKLVYSKDITTNEEKKNVLNYYKAYVRLFKKNSEHYSTDLPNHIDFSVLLAIIQEGRRMETNNLRAEYYYPYNKVKSAKRLLKARSRKYLTLERYYIELVNHLFFSRVLANRGWGELQKRVNEIIYLLYDSLFILLESSSTSNLSIIWTFYNEMIQDISRTVELNYHLFRDSAASIFFDEQEDVLAQEQLLLKFMGLRYVSSEPDENLIREQILKNYMKKTKKLHSLEKYIPEN